MEDLNFLRCMYEYYGDLYCWYLVAVELFMVYKSGFVVPCKCPIPFGTVILHFTVGHF